MVGQGATEYLVLLAVVLIVALVSVALLGFFPGMASDAQVTQSKTYWQSASPISIVEMDSVFSRAYAGISWPYLRVRNTGPYPIRLTKILGAGESINQVWCPASFCGTAGVVYISNWYYLAPGEEKVFCTTGYSGCGSSFATFGIRQDGGSTSGNVIAAYSSGCQNSTASLGTLIVDGFGFEYTQYMESQEITKQQVGAKPLIIKCTAVTS